MEAQENCVATWLNHISCYPNSGNQITVIRQKITFFTCSMNKNMLALYFAEKHACCLIYLVPNVIFVVT